ncbi:MAG: ATP-binding protein [Pseudomonadota bacterium]
MKTDASPSRLKSLSLFVDPPAVDEEKLADPASATSDGLNVNPENADQHTSATALEKINARLASLDLQPPQSPENPGDDADDDFFPARRSGPPHSSEYWPVVRESERAVEDDLAEVSTEDAMSVGHVVCVSGSQIIICLDDIDATLTNRQLRLRKGGLVKLYGPHSLIYGIVTKLSIPVPRGNGEGSGTKLAEIDLVGEGVPNAEGTCFEFVRGVTLHPSLGELVFATDAKDIERVYGKTMKLPMNVGHLHQDPNRAAILSGDKLTRSHFALLGTTGSGKSCGMTVILRAILETGSSTHILLLDPHNEYAAAFEGMAELIDPNTMELPYWLLSSEELVAVVVGAARQDTVATEASTILLDLVTSARKHFARTNGSEISEQTITADSPLPYALRDVLRSLETRMGNLDKKDNLTPYRWLKSRLETLKADARYSFMFGGISVRDSMGDILAQLFRVPANDKPKVKGQTTKHRGHDI